MSSLTELEPEKRLLERARPLDFVTLEGLSVQTNCDPTDLDVFLLKELIDNALDACNSISPKIDVKIFTKEEFVILTVKDNGKGFSEEDIKRISDFDRAYSTKFHYKYPTRGALGNALKCIFGIPYALESELRIEIPIEPIRIKSNGKEYRINLKIDKLKQQILSEIDQSDVATDGTEIRIIFPVFNPGWGMKSDYLRLIRSYSLFNTDANFTFEVVNIKLSEPFYIECPALTKNLSRFRGTSSVYWYKFSQFQQLIEAYIRSIQRGERDIPLRELIKGFRDLSSDERSAQILREIQKIENIQYISNLNTDDKLVPKLYELMKINSRDPSPDVLGELGKKYLKEEIERIYGDISDFKYKKVKNIFKDDLHSVPYVLELAIAVLKESQKFQREIHFGINHSPSLENPFEGYQFKYDENGEEKEASITLGVIEKYKIDSKQPVVLVMHLICPNIEYKSYGKGKINIEPFCVSVARTLTEICRFYPRRKRRLYSVSGKSSLARTYLEEEIHRRNKLEEDGKLSESERTTQQGIWYKVRNKMGGIIDIARKSFIQSIGEVCESIGKMREELKIFAAVRAELYFRGQVYPVSFDNIRVLATKGSDVILIEKEGVCEVLAPYASKRGVALLNSRGFAVDYAKQLLKLSSRLRSNLFILTDYDASGLLMAKNLREIPRLGVDPYMIESLGLSREKLEEQYDTKDGKAPKKHLKALDSYFQIEVKEKRIEIDAILAAVGPEKFWGYIEDRMLVIAPERDLTRSLDLSIKPPPEIEKPLTELIDYVKSIGIPMQREIKDGLLEWKKGFIDLDEFEAEIQSKIFKEIMKNSNVQELVQKLEKIVEDNSKNP